MAITLVQSRASNATGVTSIALAYTGAVTPGNALIAGFVATNNTRTITGFSDNQFGNWSQAVLMTTDFISTIFYLPTPAASGVTPTVTVTISGASAVGLVITEWSGLSQLVDQTGTQRTITTTPATVSTSSPTTAPVELAFANFAAGATGHTFTAGSGQTLVSSNSLQGVEYAITSSAATQSAQMSFEAAITTNAVIATFFPVITTQPVVTRRYVHYYT